MSNEPINEEEVLPTTDINTNNSQEEKNTVSEEIPEINLSEELEQIDAEPAFYSLFEGETVEVIEKRIIDRITDLGSAAFRASAETVGSYDNILVVMFQQYSQESERLQDVISNILDKDRFVQNCIINGKSVLGYSAPAPKLGTGNSVSGESGIVEFMRQRGAKTIRRIPLYNSGFYIQIIASTAAQVHSFILKADSEVREYGRLFGMHFYLYADLIIKRAAVEFLMPLIIGSNLRNWKKPGVLVQAISLHDYPVIFNSIAALNFPEGYEHFQHACVNPDPVVNCDHKDVGKIDLIRLNRTNFVALNDNCVTQMVSTGEITPELLKAYHKNLGMTKLVRFNKWELDLRIPSIADYLEYGARYNADLLSEVQADNTKGIYSALQFRYYRSLTPWIKEALIYQDDGTVATRSRDPDVISAVLDMIQSDDVDGTVLKEIQAYMGETQLTHICFPVYACPKCGHTPVTKTGYFVVDPVHTFFTQLARRLTLG